MDLLEFCIFILVYNSLTLRFLSHLIKNSTRTLFDTKYKPYRADICGDLIIYSYVCIIKPRYYIM
jgi:hypothetical protein